MFCLTTFYQKFAQHCCTFLLFFSIIRLLSFLLFRPLSFLLVYIFFSFPSKENLHFWGNRSLLGFLFKNSHRQQRVELQICWFHFQSNCICLSNCGAWTSLQRLDGWKFYELNLNKRSAYWGEYFSILIRRVDGRRRTVHRSKYSRIPGWRSGLLLLITENI